MRVLTGALALVTLSLLFACGGAPRQTGETEAAAETIFEAKAQAASAPAPASAPKVTPAPVFTPKPTPTPLPNPAPTITITPQVYNFDIVAHAGGAADGFAGTNSVEAVEASISRGARFVELDILRTTDGKYVCAHDWEYMPNRVAFAAAAPVSYAAFTEYRVFNRFTPLTLEGLTAILEKNPGVSIVTDTKDRDYTSLSYIAERYPEYMAQVIPQVYAFEDFDVVKAMGYKKIIITLYAMAPGDKSDPNAVAARVRELSAYALTIPDELAAIPGYTDTLRERGVRFFVHTVNDIERAAQLYNAGAAGVYTDYLYMRGNAPGGFVELKGDATIDTFAVGDTSYIPLGDLIKRYGATNYKYLATDRSVVFTYRGSEFALKSGSVTVTRTRANETKSVYPGGVMTAFNGAFYISAEISTAIFGGT
jgi:glycerophosphoryl diester phosphodiesterase